MKKTIESTRGPYKNGTIEERFEVERYAATPEARRVARERTEDLLAAFLCSGARYDAIGPLVESCYLQGVEDAAQALLITGHKIVRIDGERG